MVNHMSEMIERVGRALAKEEGYAYDPLPYDDRARAAIEAMREPSRAICEVAWKETRGTLLEEGYADAVDEVELHFNAVIDAVLGTNK